jgi:hypothetical protein
MAGGDTARAVSITHSPVRRFDKPRAREGGQSAARRDSTTARTGVTRPTFTAADEESDEALVLPLEEAWATAAVNLASVSR